MTDYIDNHKIIPPWSHMSRLELSSRLALIAWRHRRALANNDCVRCGSHWPCDTYTTAIGEDPE